MGFGSIVRRAVKAVGGDVTREVGNQVERGAQGVNREWKDYGRDTYRDGVYGGYGIVAREIGRHSGYNSDERQSLGRGLGANYAAVEATKDMRVVDDANQRKLEMLSKQQSAEETKARLQAGVRVRRRTGIDAPGTKGGTVVTGALGIPGGGAGGSSFASLLGY